MQEWIDDIEFERFTLGKKLAKKLILNPLAKQNHAVFQLIHIQCITHNPYIIRELLFITAVLCHRRL